AVPRRTSSIPIPASSKRSASRAISRPPAPTGWPRCWRRSRSMRCACSHEKGPVAGAFPGHARCAGNSIAHLLLQMFAAFLRVQRQRRDRASLEAFDADFLLGFLAVAVAAFLDPSQRLVDLGNQLAVAITRAQLQRVLRLAGGALGIVADIAHFLAQVLHRLPRFLDQLVTPVAQLVA